VDATEQQRDQPVALHGRQHAAAFLLACAVLITRRPDAIIHARFYREDGHIFFADAYNLGGWPALLRPYAGYFHTVPRLAALLALLVPFALAPLVMNTLGILVQAIPVNLLLSTRNSAWGSLRFRALMATIYIALPDNAEITWGVCAAQWPLALGMILLVVGSVPRGRIGRTFDCIFFAVAGLTGPFCILILPIATFLAWVRKEGWRWVQCSVLALCSVIQLGGLLILDPRGRPNTPIGIDPALFIRMLGGDVFAGALLGRVGLSVLPGTSGLIVLLCVASGGLAIMIGCFRNTHAEMKLFIVFTCLVFAASLLRPTEYPPAGVTMWGLMYKAGGVRYWFLPSLAFAWTILWCARSGTEILKSAASILLCLMIFGVVMGWENPASKDIHFAEYAKSFEDAPAGAVFVVPESGPGWDIRLVKHSVK
jgi:hypothetical protein